MKRSLERPVENQNWAAQRSKPPFKGPERSVLRLCVAVDGLLQEAEDLMRGLQGAEAEILRGGQEVSRSPGVFIKMGAKSLRIACSSPCGRLFEYFTRSTNCGSSRSTKLAPTAARLKASSTVVLFMTRLTRASKQAS